MPRSNRSVAWARDVNVFVFVPVSDRGKLDGSHTCQNYPTTERRRLRGNRACACRNEICPRENPAVCGVRLTSVTALVSSRTETTLFPRRCVLGNPRPRPRACPLPVPDPYIIVPDPCTKDGHAHGHGRGFTERTLPCRLQTSVTVTDPPAPIPRTSTTVGCLLSKVKAIVVRFFTQRTSSA
jgi:hypothetical protein